MNFSTPRPKPGHSSPWQMPYIVKKIPSELTGRKKKLLVSVNVSFDYHLLSLEETWTALFEHANYLKLKYRVKTGEQEVKGLPEKRWGAGFYLIFRIYPAHTRALWKTEFELVSHSTKIALKKKEEVYTLLLTLNKILSIAYLNSFHFAGDCGYMNVQHSILHRPN
ncbi:hypothetical protein BaRGS_00018634 [Batillaria attramentaria]|uniref:Uncharacterized protein n=1 Tax=Batillaria attramentaria TaxID=370345 RepID=A0ABD0KS80_9CAEN